MAQPTKNVSICSSENHVLCDPRLCRGHLSKVIDGPITCNLGNRPVDFGVRGRTDHDLRLHVIGVETSAIMG